MKVTPRRKRSFAQRILGNTPAKIGFIDVGSGGPLKHPWDVLPAENLQTYSIEPTDGGNELPLCISNRVGQHKFYVAHNERGSSLHETSPEFVDRFGKQSLMTKKVIDVSVTTLDEHFSGKYGNIDLLDINTEGHDYQVLEGSRKLLGSGFVKVIKVEYELTEVWKGQGWFSDIDSFLREQGFELAKIEMEEAKPVNVAHISCASEPLWGKAYYVPSRLSWKSYLSSESEGLLAAKKAVTLFTLIEAPGRAYDLIDLCVEEGLLKPDEADVLKKDIRETLKYLILGEARRECVRFLKLPFRVVKYLFT